MQYVVTLIEFGLIFLKAKGSIKVLLSFHRLPFGLGKSKYPVQLHAVYLWSQISFSPPHHLFFLMLAQGLAILRDKGKSIKSTPLFN